LIPDEQGGYHAPTAQHASREGKVLAHNIVANVRGEDLMPFRFKTLGLLASIGRRTGVARILGINFSGFIAWWLWRTIYLLKLPRAEKKLRVALDWTLDLFFSKDFVQYIHECSPVLDDISPPRLPGQAVVANQLSACRHAPTPDLNGERARRSEVPFSNSERLF
jgi:NADH dehydrogenase